MKRRKIYSLSFIIIAVLTLYIASYEYVLSYKWQNIANRVLYCLEEIKRDDTPLINTGEVAKINCDYVDDISDYYYAQLIEIRKMEARAKQLAQFIGRDKMLEKVEIAKKQLLRQWRNSKRNPPDPVAQCSIGKKGGEIFRYHEEYDKLRDILDRMSTRINDRLYNLFRYKRGLAWTGRAEVFRKIQTDEFEIVADDDGYLKTGSLKSFEISDQLSAANSAGASGKTTQFIPHYSHSRHLVLFQPLKFNNEVVAILAIEPDVYFETEYKWQMFRLGLIALITLSLLIFLIGENFLLGQYPDFQAKEGSLKKEKWYPSLYKIVRGDTTANYLMIGFIFIYPFIMFMIYRYLDPSQEERWFAILFSLIFSFPIPIILWRAHRIRYLFKNGVEVECIFVNKEEVVLGWRPDYGKPITELVGNYVYFYEDQIYLLSAKLIKSKSEEKEIALVDPHDPENAIFRENYT